MKFLSRTLSLVFLSHAACFVSDDFAPKTEGMTPDSGINTDAVAPFVPSTVWVDNLRSEAFFDVNTSAVDSKGNIYLAGSCKSDKSITIGNQDHPAIRNSPQTLDYFIVSLDADGDFRWFQRFGTDSTVSEEALERDEIYEIIFDENDNLYLAGQYRGTLTIQGLADNLTAPPSKTAAFVVSFDKEGNVRWLQSYTREEPESSLWASYASSLTIDSDGQLQVLLHSYGPTSSYLISVLEVRAYALETGDSEVAAKEIARGNLTRKPTIRSRGEKGLIIGGGFVQGGDPDGMHILFFKQLPERAKGSDIYLIHTDNSANLTTIETLAGESIDTLASIDTNSDGHYVIAGSFSKDIHLTETSSLTESSTSATRAIYVAYYKEKDQLEWKKSYELTTDYTNPSEVSGLFSTTVSLDAQNRVHLAYQAHGGEHTMLGKSYSAIDSYRACFLSHDQEGNHIDGFCPKATYFSRGESIASFGNQVFISGPYFGDITISGKTLLSSGKPPLMEENSFLLRRDFGP